MEPAPAVPPGETLPVKEGAGKGRRRRLELRTSNLAAWERGGEQPGLGKLDTSLKRHTALLVRLRSSLHTPAALAGILKDVTGLMLEKYIEEAVGAVIEGLGKCKSGPEIIGAVDIISALHGRFPELFTPPFVHLLLQNLKPTKSSTTDRDLREKEDNARVIRQRGLLRVLGELEAVGIARKDGGKGAVGDSSWGVLKELLTADKEALALAAPLGIAFAKHLGHLYLPPPPPATGAIDDTHEFPTLAQAVEGEPEDAIVTREVKDKFRKLLLAYLDALGKQEAKQHVELQKADKRNHEAYIRSGEVFDDREKNYERAMRAWERAWASVTQLCEILVVPVPALPSLTATLTTSIIGTGSSSFATGEEYGGPGSLWLDEEDKMFYEELRELRGEVPGSVLGVVVSTDAAVEDKEGKEEAQQTEEEKEAEEELKDEELDAKDEIENPMAALSLDAPDAALPAGPAAQLTALFARLQDASSKSTIDGIALEFAFLNSKAARKRLVKFLGSVHRNRQDILPYYARLVATLDPYMPDIGKELVSLLEDEFRYLQRKKLTDMAETRSKNLRFLSELTKFKITPTHSILHVFKVLLDDFTGPNVDNLCTVLEGCGRFLLRTEATTEKMQGVLQTMTRKKAAMPLDQRQVTMLENAYYQCNPPDRPAIAPKERTPMQLYIRTLFYHVLMRNSSDQVLKLARKLHWEDPAARPPFSLAHSTLTLVHPQIVRKLHSAFTKVWKIKYSNVHLFAVLLYDLGRYHPEFKIGIIDEVLENIRVGMEVNSFKYNQQRIATVKYLGELYNYRVVEPPVILDTLWSLVTFGHPEGRPWPEVPSPIDAPDDCFRVRLVCTLLDTCGSCFVRGALKKKLDNFITFFQMYTLSKGTMPMDVDFMLSDTYEELRPKLELFKTFSEAAMAVDEMMATVATSGPVEDDVDEGEGLGDDREAGPRHEVVEEEEEDGSSGSESDSESDEGEDADDSEDEENARPKDPNAITEEEEDEFNRELAKMLANTGEVRKVVERKLDLSVPYVKRDRARTTEEEEAEEKEGRGMRFMLLTKKGSKQQALTVEIPMESSIAIHTLEKRAQNKAEQQQLKRLVLDYEQREEASEKQALKDSMARRGIQLRYMNPKPT